jgi:Tfp pilus assembly protein PilE
MTWNLKKLKCSFSFSWANCRVSWKTLLKKLTRKSVWFKYRRICSSCERYWATEMKSTKTRTKFTAWDHLSINNEIITRMICFIIVFCFTSIHCFTFEKLKNVFNSMNDETLLNRISNLSNSNKSLNLIEKFFRFRLTNKWVFNKNLIQINKCIIIFFINWWRMFIIMISCILIKLCFQTKFLTSWTQFFFRFVISFFRWWRICLLINSWMR